MPRPTHPSHQTRPHVPPMTLKVIYQITDAALATQVRQALAADDVERLDELITYLNSDGTGETGVVLTVREVRR